MTCLHTKTNAVTGQPEDDIEEEEDNDSMEKLENWEGRADLGSLRQHAATRRHIIATQASVSPC